MGGIVIVGAGHAAGQAAASLRQEKYAGDITIVGDESHIPYQRPPLSKGYLANELPLERVHLRPAKFYADQRIELHTDTRVTAIDPAARSLQLSGGKVLDYQGLLLATGTRVRELQVSGRELAGIHYLRTIADVDRMRDGMTPGKRLVIVGGGYIGLEVAAVARKLGLEVTVLEMEARILQRVTCATMSAFYHDLHVANGVTIRLQTGVTGFAGADGQVREVLCGDERLAADMVIIGIGVVPNTEVAEAAGIRCDNGILVDEHCRTSIEDIYAAGDCTNHPNPLLGRRLRLESVPNAMEQARVAAANLAGGSKTYASLPWFWSDQYDLKLQMAGFSADGDTEVLRGDMASRQFVMFYLKDGCVVAADAVNSPGEFMVCRQLYGKPATPQQLADPAFELKSLSG